MSGKLTEDMKMKCDQAKVLLMDAAHRGCIDSWYHLGSIHENGLDGCVDIDKALW